MQKEKTERIKKAAYEIGFDLVGISPVGDFPESQYYKNWLNRGYEASMSYMSRNSQKREDVRQLMPEAKSVICCAINYNSDHPYSNSLSDSSRGWIARYAWGDDYHKVMTRKLNELKEFIISGTETGCEILVYVDTGPVLERMYAKYAGIGWIGKNTCLINQDIGSWLFLGEIITNVELDYDSPAAERCGSCTECIDKCPTDAIIKPYELDSSRCISYFTIENKEEIPSEYRERTGNNIFGCDICQDVCPWNSKAGITKAGEFEPRDGFFSPDLEYFLDMDQNLFSELFRDSPVKRAKRKGLLRNVLVAAGNSGNSRYSELVKKFLTDNDPLVRKHAVWALWKLQGRKSYDIICSMLRDEDDLSVIEEINDAIHEIEGQKIRTDG